MCVRVGKEGLAEANELITPGSSDDRDDAWRSKEVLQGPSARRPRLRYSLQLGTGASRLQAARKPLASRPSAAARQPLVNRGTPAACQPCQL